MVSYKYVETDNRTVITKSPSSDYDIDGNSEGDSLAFTLNQLDQCTSTSQYHFFGEKKTTMTYTMEGLLSVFSSGLKSNGHSSSHSYDEQKRLISQHNSWHGINQIGNYVGYESTKYTYDSTGLINSIEINKNIDDREIYPTRLHSGPSDERNNRAERAPEIRTLKYTFDEIGNWIECEHYSLAGELVFKEKREIEYF